MTSHFSPMRNQRDSLEEKFVVVLCIEFRSPGTSVGFQELWFDWLESKGSQRGLRSSHGHGRYMNLDIP